MTSVSEIWLSTCLNESPFQEGNKNRKANKSHYLWQNICPQDSLETGDYCLEGKKPIKSVPKLLTFAKFYSYTQ